MRRVVVTGLGVVAPNGIGREAFWSACVNGRSGVGPIRSFDASGHPVRIAAEVPSASGDRYDAAITSSGRLRIRRWRSGTATLLGDVASGIPDLRNWASLSFTVTGTSPVVLTAAVNGQPKLTVSDGSPSAIGTAGYAGFTATASGVWFDDFRLSVAGRSP